MPNTLFVCSLPIGNDLDVSQRVLECLKTTSFIACEDTRVTKELLKRLNILISKYYFEWTNFKRSFGLFSHILMIMMLRLFLMREHGISDPGALLVDYCIQQNISVKILPGASSITAFISGSGYQISDFYFGGFMPRKKTE